MLKPVIHLHLLLTLSLIFLLMPISALAQISATTASITGNVTDEQGAIISRASIRAKNLETNLIRETSSGEDGSFLISQLPPGTYQMIVSADGFANNAIRVDLVLGTTLLLNVTLNLGLDYVVEVQATNVVETGRTESSFNNGRGRIDELPINRRNFLDFSLTSPRVTVDRGPQQGNTVTSGLSFNCQTARGNNITIDGLDNNDQFSGAVRATFSQDAVQEFQVVSDGYSAEFGRAIGGIVNIVTRGGGNEPHGSLFFLNRNDSISARAAFSSLKPEFQQYQFGGAVSGPIKKDRAFFFGSFERLSVRQNNIVTISNDSIAAGNQLGFPVTNGPIPFSEGITSVLARSDLRLGANDQLFLRFNFGGVYNGQLEPFGALIDQTHAGIQRLKDSSLAINNTYFNTKLNLVNETRLLYTRRNQTIEKLDLNPEVNIIAPEGNIRFGSNPGLTQLRADRIYQIIDNISLTRGNHQIKFGGDLLYIDTLGKSVQPLLVSGVTLFTPFDFTPLTGLPNSFLTGLQNFDPSLRTPAQRAFLTTLSNTLPNIVPGFPAGLPLADLSIPIVFVQGFGLPRLSLGTKEFSAFLQDDIRVKQNLLIKVGLRYDLNRVSYADKNDGNFSPRIGISYQPNKLPKLHLHAAFGLFFGAPINSTAFTAQTTTSGSVTLLVLPFPFSILPFSLPQHKFPESTQLPAGVPFIPQLSQVLISQPKLRNSYSEQADFGIDYYLGNNTEILLSYQYLRGIRIFGQRNINPVVHPVPGNPIASAIVGRLDPTRGNVIEFGSTSDSYYNAFTITLNRRLANNISLLAHYTFSKAIDNFLDFRPDTGDLPVDPLNLRAERGLSLQDARSRFVFSGSWQLNYTRNPLLRDFQLSTIINLQSGRPYNLLTGVDLDMNGDNGSDNLPGDRPAGIGRNVGVTPGFASLDLRVTRSFTIKERYRFIFIGEVFNLFNRTNISDVNRVFPPDGQGNFNLPPKDGNRFIATPDRFTNSFAPRQFQIGFRISF